MNRQMKENLLRGSDAYPFALYQMPFANQTVATSFHWQDDVEILSITNGEIELTLNSKITMLHPGDIVCINPGQLHSFRGITSDARCDIFIFPLEHLLFAKKDHNQNRYLNALIDGNYGFPLYLATDPIIRELILQAIELQKQQPVAYEMMTKALLLQIIALLARANHFLPLCPVKQDGTCKKILNYIHQHYTERITVSDISAAVGISATYFSSFFTEHFHQHFSDYLRKYRIEQACLMLTGTSLSVTEIALATGFCSCSHFIQNFYTDKSMTPLTYRKKTTTL